MSLRGKKKMENGFGDMFWGAIFTKVNATITTQENKPEQTPIYDFSFEMKVCVSHLYAL